MIEIIQVKDTNKEKYDYIKCPLCKGRICNKPIKSKVYQINKMADSTSDHLLVICNKCKTKYFIKIK